MPATVKKTECNVSREEFRSKAKGLAVDIAGNILTAVPRDFSTGSFGFFTNGKIALKIGETPVLFQVGVTLTAIGSKDRP